MSRRSPIPQSRRHVLVFDEDWEFLKHYYEAGPGVAARGIIHAYVARVRAKAEAMLETESGGITKLGDEL